MNRFDRICKTIGNKKGQLNKQPALSKSTTKRTHLTREERIR